MLLAIGIEHALDLPVQASHDADPGNSLVMYRPASSSVMS
jgi:hypothetical protein